MEGGAVACETVQFEVVPGASVAAREENRQRWGSRHAFLLATIGSVVGIGNIWRFPALCYKHGGGTFLVPYFLCLIVIGLPILLLELSLGMMFRAGDIEAFGGIHRRLRGIGISSIIAAAVASSYYVAIVAWSVVYLVSSFVNPLPWTAEAQGLDPSDCPLPGEKLTMVFAAEENYLYNSVLHLAPPAQLAAGRSYIIAGWVYGGLLVICVSSYFALRKGTTTLIRALYFTCTSPILILLLLFAYNISLPGATHGVMQYIGVWDTSALRDPQIWTDAGGQVFFTLSIGLGVMTAFGSYAPQDINLVTDHMIIVLANTVVSLLAGCVVYAVLGNVVHEEQKRCPEAEVDMQSIYSSASITLVFIAYPRGLSNFPDKVSNLMGVLFFFSFLFLGLDSVFSVYQAFITVVSDTTRFRHETTSSLVTVVLGTTFVGATLFCTDIGPYLFDCLDHYLSSYVLLTMGVLECNAVGWVYGHRDSVKRVGKLSSYVYTSGYHSGYLIGITICASLSYAYDFRHYENLIIGVLVGIGIFLLCSLGAFFLRCDSRITFISFFRSVLLCGTEKLREELYSPCLPFLWLWDIMIKYICPPLLLGLIVVEALGDISRKGHLMGGMRGSDGQTLPYPLWLQLTSIAMLFFVWLAFFINIFLPAAWEAAAGMVVLQSSRGNSFAEHAANIQLQRRIAHDNSPERNEHSSINSRIDETAHSERED